MKKHSRILLSTFCVGALLFAVFILAVNLYVQSPSVQNRIRTALSAATGMPVGVFRTTFSPWGGFRLDQVKIPSQRLGVRADFLRAEVLEVRCALIPLLMGKIVLKRIALDTPQFVFQRNAQGRYDLPAPSEPVVVSTPSKPTSAAAEVGVTIPQATPAPVQPSSEKLSHPSRQAARMDIRKLLLRNGTFRFLGQNGEEFLRLEGVRCSLNAAPPASEAFSGVLEIEKLVFLNRWEALNLEGGVNLRDGKLTVEKLAGAMNDGHFEASGEVNLGDAKKAYSLHMRLGKGRLEKFFAASPDLANEIDGMVQARMDYNGFFAEQDQNRGSVEVKISNAKVGGLPYFQLISQMTRSAEFGNLPVRKAELKAQIVNSVIQINPSTLVSERLQVTYSGQVDPKDNLDVQAQLQVDDHLFRKLPSEARENFVKDPASGSQTLAFTVTGSVSTPKTNLIDRLIGDKLQKKLKNFLGSFGGEEEHETPDETPQK